MCKVHNVLFGANPERRFECITEDGSRVKGTWEEVSTEHDFSIKATVKLDDEALHRVHGVPFLGIIDGELE